MNGRQLDDVTCERLKGIEDSIDARRGWDFSRMQTEREPVPWDYLEIVPRYLKPTDTVLDVGTGGGEKFLAFSPLFARGVGIDPDPGMIRVARENGATRPNVTFLEMGAESLAFPEATFDIVLTRHAPVRVPEVVRVLKPGGYFVTQQIGSANMANIKAAFGREHDTRYDDEFRVGIEEFAARGCRVVTTGAYDVRYWVKDTPSLIFWLEAIAGSAEVPEGFSVERDWRAVAHILRTASTAAGVLTNEARTLLIVQKGD